MRKWIVLLVPLLAIIGVSACSGGSVTTTLGTVTTTTLELAGTPATTIAGATGTGLEGVEFIIHQAPG